MSRKRPKKPTGSPKFCVDWLPTATNQEQAISLATWLKTRFRGHLVHPQPPTLCGFHPSKSPKRTPRPPYRCALCCGQLEARAETAGCQNGSTGSTGGKKMAVFKVAPRPRGMPKQVVLACFEPLVARFGPLKMAKCFENGCFWGRKRVKKGSKTRFSKNDIGPFGVHKQVK